MTLLWFSVSQSFFGLGQSADIDIVLADQETRKSAEIKAEDGKKKRHFLFYDGESVSGKVSVPMYDSWNIIFYNNYLLFRACEFYPRHHSSTP